MKNKILPIIITTTIIVAIAIIAIISLDHNKIDDDIVEINYTYGGGYGTIIDASFKTITFTSEGKVLLSNNYNSYIETLDIDQNKYKELKDFILERMSLFNEKAKEENGVSDGGSSKIKIILKSGQVKEIGGYMIRNKKFDEIKNKIYEIIDYKRLNQYEKNIEVDETIY